ncbi:MAG: class I SAM-dependent methyltransferase [Gemmatimonadaceae bacterium]
MPEARLRCRSCGEPGLEVVLSLGHTPLANALLDETELAGPEPTYPLELAFCSSCTLLQITESVPPEKLFREYPYFSSFSDTMLRHAKALADELTTERRLGSGKLVIEVASNDGYLLQFYKAAGIRVLGIEPALNIAGVAEERGIPTLAEFFGTELADRLRGAGERAAVLHAHNVLAHVPDLNGFVRAIGTVLADDGVAVIEVPYARDMIERCEFDTIYHEHLCYFSVTSLVRLFERHGLRIQHIQRVPIHGGSLRLRVVFPSRVAAAPTVTALLEEERDWGMASVDVYRAFSGRVRELKTALLGLLARLRSNGGRIAAYGASAKGSTLLNCFGIGGETLEFIVDRSTVKQGRYAPGTHLPIVPPERLLETMPTHVLLLTWNFADEILTQQAEYRRRGGRFIVPLPTPQIL